MTIDTVALLARPKQPAAPRHGGRPRLEARWERRWVRVPAKMAATLLLVCSLCLLLLAVSHRLVTSAGLEHAPFLAIGRSIQEELADGVVVVSTATMTPAPASWAPTSPPLPRPVPAPTSQLDKSWSSAELDAWAGNRSLDMEGVINQQRLVVAQEMSGYRYPAGKYNVSARALSDLVPELGGQPLRSVIVTTWRSGSTFLGDVLHAHPANFYHYEPLLHYDIVQIRGEPLASGAVETLRSLMHCNYTGLSTHTLPAVSWRAIVDLVLLVSGDYLDYGPDHTWLFSHNTRLWDACQRRPDLCWQPQFLNPFCRLFPFQSMKVVRLRLRLMEELLADPSLNIRVALLVRDPRGTLQSRKHRDWCPGREDCYKPQRLCMDLVSDYSAAQRLAKLYPGRFRAMRYEDLSVEPYKEVQELFKLYGLDFHPSVQEFLDTHTKVDVGGVSSTYRNSKSAPFHWRQDLKHREVLSIQSTCKEAMKLWGYLPALNLVHQKEFNPLGNYSLH